MTTGLQTVMTICGQRKNAEKVCAQAYGPSTDVQPSEAPVSAPVPSVVAPKPYAYSGMPAYAARAPSPIIASPSAYSPPAYGARPPAYGSYGGAL